MIAEQARILASEIPSATLDAFTDAVLKVDFRDWDIARGQVLQELANPAYRAQAERFLDTWHRLAPSMTAEAAATAISTASLAEQVRRDTRSVELVWTGPDSDTIPTRQTKQALLQVINAATQKLIVVSYAVFNIPHIRDALVRAARRGVVVTVIVESADPAHGGEAYSTIQALGNDVAHVCSVYIWPGEKRGKDAKGKSGILHVKCAVADGQWAFLSSANLTEYAFTVNMEMGVLFRGGRIPEQMQRHFEGLIRAGVFVRV